ncbi:Hypothetical_protein [Hexamita inflata]|uniref:Hypothetical_protein n=1 Tax=Hexamita inflata TaxID=28002 RepID=A0AA86VQ11_9EUKA|nr:Hypothetical protein HINF_LOCUS60573 [Hexamita inflata]
MFIVLRKLKNITDGQLRRYQQYFLIFELNRTYQHHVVVYFELVNPLIDSSLLVLLTRLNLTGVGLADVLRGQNSIYLLIGILQSISPFLAQNSTCVQNWANVSASFSSFIGSVLNFSVNCQFVFWKYFYSRKVQKSTKTGCFWVNNQCVKVGHLSIFKLDLNLRAVKMRYIQSTSSQLSEICFKMKDSSPSAKSAGQPRRKRKSDNNEQIFAYAYLICKNAIINCVLDTID